MTHAERDAPLASIGLPTYNRVDRLQHAVASVLGQDYPNIELVISDNASTDETREWCEELSRRDSRVRYIRQQTNIGLTANYAAVFWEARGAFYMAFADDDRLDPSYVSQCVQALIDHPDYANVSGKVRMFREQDYLFDGRGDSALQESGEDRIVHYLRRVVENGAIYGVMRRETVATVPPMPNIMAGDWLYISSIAFKGKLRTLDSVGVNRAAGGTSATWEAQARAYNLPSYIARLRGLPYLVIMWSVFKDIGWESPVYRPLGRLGRLVLAFRAVRVVVIKFSILIAGIIASHFHERWRLIVTRLMQARLR